MGPSVVVRGFGIFLFERLIESRVVVEADAESHVLDGNIRRHKELGGLKS